MGYLEEQAVVTYTEILSKIDAGKERGHYRHTGNPKYSSNRILKITSREKVIYLS